MRISRSPGNVPLGGSLTLILSSPSATASLGRLLGRALTGGEVLALIGELGVGKTALVKGIAAGLGVPSIVVSSPTFVLVHEYTGRLPLIHADLYRLHTLADAENIGVQEHFIGPAVTAIEWADRFPSILPEDHLEIRLDHTRANTRTARFSAHGPGSLSLLTQMTQSLRLKEPSLPTRSSPAKGQRKAVKR